MSLYKNINDLLNILKSIHNNYNEEEKKYLKSAYNLIEELIIDNFVELATHD